MNISTEYRGQVIAGTCAADHAVARSATIGRTPLIDIPTQLDVKTRALVGDDATQNAAYEYTDSRIGNTTVAPINLNFEEGTFITFDLGSGWEYRVSYVEGAIKMDFAGYYDLYTEFASPIRFRNGIRTDTLVYNGRPVPLVSLEIRPFTVDTVTAPQFGVYGSTPFATYRYSAGIDSACFANVFTTIGATANLDPEDQVIAGIYMMFTTSGTSTLPILFRLRAVYQQQVDPIDDPTYTETELMPSGDAGKLVTCKLNIPVMTITVGNVTPLLAKFERYGTADSNPDDLHVWRMAYGCPKIGFTSNV